MPPLPTFRNPPLRLGSDDDFARVRHFFATAGFETVTLCRTLDIERMSELGAVCWDTVPWDRVSRELTWSIKVFLRGGVETELASRVVCGDAVFAAFVALELLAKAKRDPLSVWCPVWVYPADGFVVASDRRDHPEGAEQSVAEDVVFPAIYAGTERFLRLLPDARGGTALDLCGGSGIGALRLTGTARSAVTADLTERSAFFAAFNARLNATAVESLCGNLYAPVAGRQFDVITAHPPFVPATSQNMVYRDGGEAGEDVTRGVVSGLPTHLRPGGSCLVLCVACDTEEKNFEQRVAAWLGHDAPDFEIVFGLEKILSVEELVESVRKRGQSISDAEAKGLYGRLRALGTRRFVYGALFIRRLHGGTASPPVRVHLCPEGGAGDFERTVEWRRAAREPGFLPWIQTVRPSLAPALELSVRHVMRDGELVPAEFILRVAAGFEAAMRLDGWVVPLVARLDGVKTIKQIFGTAREAEELPADFTMAAFCSLIATLVEHGFLVVAADPRFGDRPVVIG